MSAPVRSRGHASDHHADDQHAPDEQHTPDGERGGILVLTLGALAVAAALIVTIAVASAVYLDRRDLLALADATAADAAAAIDTDSYYGGEITLTDDAVRAAARDFLASAPAGVTDAPGLAVADPTGAIDATTAEVTLVAFSRPAWLPWALAPWSDGIALRVTVTARGGGG
ncbi:glycosyltransferase [Miniimonas arenae]|uniref:Glycosyltransferase n=1 Tax=Miniimonas arenae TaxID=676201 RepID=A0A5C5BDF5_9MICO|nr:MULTISPECIES: glycosyltransferase [Miniimonas]TNU75814.1 glycosyltransferase [Miniimonas arenae]